MLSLKRKLNNILKRGRLLNDFKDSLDLWFLILAVSVREIFFKILVLRSHTHTHFDLIALERGLNIGIF